MNSRLLRLFLVFASGVALVGLDILLFGSNGVLSVIGAVIAGGLVLFTVVQAVRNKDNWD